MSSMPSPTLAPRVFLAFDDFSRAGKHVLRLASGSPSTLSPLSALQSTEFERHVRCWTTEDEDASCIVVDSALIPATEHWKLADALATTLSDANVQVLTILGAVHLPYAKPASDSVVYYASLGGAGCEDLVPSASFQPLDADWEIKDSFLSSLLHLLAVERSMTVQLLLAKGYRPGRNLSGTYEAAETLADALKAWTSGKLAVDPTDLKLKLPALLAADPSRGHDSAASPSIDHDALLLYN